jgi:hypothetical protein
MEKFQLEVLIDKNLSQREIAKELDTSQVNVRYWLKKFSLKTKIPLYNKASTDDKEKICIKCNILLPIEDFYIRSRENRTRHECRKCANEKATKRQVDTKLRMIQYKGGKCDHCSLKVENSHAAVFDFHHLDPSIKEKNLSNIKSAKWENIVKELDKCILLCANCHRMEHTKT